MKLLRTFLSAVLLLTSSNLLAQFNKAAYYAKAEGKKGAALKTALAEIISPHTTISYDGLYEAYKTTDTRPDGKIWDMYSNITNYDPDKDRAGTYRKEGDCFNREHSIPQSIFSERAPMKTDIYHVIPTDGYVNNRRSNYCFGEVGSVEYQSAGGFSKVGSPSSRIKAMGCSESKVFEPNDEYKGDQARSCFYFVTCYEKNLTSFGHFGMFSNNAYPSLTEWAIKMLMEWSAKDRVSTKENNRIEAAYAKQSNRNPFIDFPGLEQYIWGEYKNVAFSVENYVDPYSGVLPPDDGGDEPGDEPGIDIPSDTTDVTIEGDYAYVKVQTNLNDWRGEYLIVYEDGNLVLNGALSALDAADNGLEVSIAGDAIPATDLVDEAVFTVSPISSTGTYSIKSGTGVYIGMEGSKNGLATSADPLPCTLSVSNGVLELASNLTGTQMFLRYNKSATRFRFYKTGQEPIALYRKTPKDAGESAVAQMPSDKPMRNFIFDVTGRRLEHIPTRGIYIMNGRKYVR